MPVNLLLIVVSISFAVCGQLSLKIGMNKVGAISSAHLGAPLQTALEVFTNLNVLVGLVLYVCAAMLWLVVLSRVDLSLAYPMMGLSYVLVLIISKLALGEDIVPLRWIGVLLITTGVVFISRSSA